MRFIDPAIKIHFREVSADSEGFGNTVSFKAFLEDIQEQFVIINAPIPMQPIGARFDSMVVSSKRKLRIVFNVFSEDRKEAYDNYRKLKSLIDMLKASYTNIDGKPIPDNRNSYGIVNILFSGLQILENGKNIIPLNFSYEVNKDLGYIQMPFNQKNGYKEFYSNGNMSLVPLGFKINLECDLGLSFDEKVKIEDPKKPGEDFANSDSGSAEPAQLSGSANAAAAAPVINATDAAANIKKWDATSWLAKNAKLNEFIKKIWHPKTTTNVNTLQVAAGHAESIRNLINDEGKCSSKDSNDIEKFNTKVNAIKDLVK